ncbi:MAG: hypothetical protein LC640_03375, partial [Frankia sp.]|nr:hypothetical protein [Frankia sp.]
MNKRIGALLGAATCLSMALSTAPHAVVTALGHPDAARMPMPLDDESGRGVRGASAPRGVHESSLAAARALAAATRRTDPAVAKAKWQLVGPSNIGGRTLDIVPDVKKRNVVYAATAGAGVWVSSNAGRTFREAWPRDNVQPVGALAMGKKGTLYAGTGESPAGGGSITWGGDGVWRSSDRGKTWKHVGLTQTERIGRIAIDPRSDNTVFVAASGPAFRGGGQRGLFRTRDGGKTWQLVLAGANATTGAVDVAIDPVNPQRVFAAMWDRTRSPERRQSGGIGSGLYRSTDGGTTWSAVLPVVLSNNPDLGRIGVAVAPSDHDKVYATVGGYGGVDYGMWASDDGGVTFTPQPTVILSNGVGGSSNSWFGRVYVDPKDPTHVYATGVGLHESHDAGANWTDVPGIHADNHGMAWDPLVKDRVYVGNDGGFYTSVNNGRRFEHA